jgi:hypothetical protein
LKEFPYIFYSFLQIIRDVHLSDRQCIEILRKLRKFWPDGIPSYVPKALKEKKRLLDHLFDRRVLNATTEHHFLDENDEPMTR